MGTDEWFERLLAELPGDLTPVSDAEREALLDLARVAAHSSERWTAPISTFLLGVAYAGASSDERAAAARGLVERLEP